MKKLDDERRASDVRYAAARRAAEALTLDASEADRDAAYAELREAHRHVTRHARRAGSDAMKEQEGA